jgi:hypothetical protein
MKSAQLLSAFESCNRKGVWSRDWEKWKITDTEMLGRSICAGLLSARSDFNVVSGEECMALGAEPGLDSKQYDIYSQTVHLASLADLLTFATRKPGERPWLIPEDISIGGGVLWRSSVLLDPTGTYLRRLALVSNWNDDRHFAECRTWQSLGEICTYSLPMQLVVAVIGSSRDGKRHGPWTKAYRHPVNRGIRFRNKSNPETGFKQSWTKIWREDFDDIETETWFQQMVKDGVIADYFFKIDIPVPEAKARKGIVDLAAERLDEIYSANELPPKQLSTCDHPVPCCHRGHCHKGDPPSGRYGFVKIDSL